ncbi:SDR family NAD(P)-dependent oxidoreductase [Gordonia sp. (in: high G+C Gram-positive bacteria)]|uniref:SDR family NAD(P)-dependent oxidoreductase n=1 Tax=Gordonia sp. (in: high G+C Gram-positive bacteria) TaxID=84139 RepID=UPI00169E57F7|nr:SDR family NAD(P)-dependent oxidoreductase [Gordonia sp. (in: high G+C Gram-positive bacteria)]NLG46901.1 SDR family NAD(P)-dependent oxidoreductase [Gordonia sp. (in: high G+C Gram-positive bacteria)]
MTDLTKYGPWALIVGGSEGVGSAFAKQLAADGFNIVLMARNAERLEAAAVDVREAGAEVRTVALDLLADDAIDKLIAATADIEVGLLILNAGANTYGSEFVGGDLDKHLQVLDLNVTRQIPLVHHFAQAMVERGRGGVILVGSLSGYSGSDREGIYAASKAFSRIFAEGLWAESKPRGVDVLHLVLGLTRTPAMARKGLNFDIPGISASDPEAVAAEGLAHLADGPVWITEGNVEVARARSSATGRDTLILKSIEGIKKIVGKL